MTRFFLKCIAAAVLASSPCYAAPENESLTEIYQRNAFEVSYSDAEEAVSQALIQKGAADKISSRVNGHKPEAIFAYTKPLSVKTRGVEFNKKTGRWTASLLFESNGEIITAMPASGTFEEMIEVPVLKREVRNGDEIRETDIEIRDFVLSHTRSDTVNDLASLIGKTPLRSISANRPIRAAEVVDIPILKKDALVQMRFTAPGMEITAHGQTLSQGARGDVINVRNVSSKKIVRAMIESSDTVLILSPAQETSQLLGDNHATN